MHACTFMYAGASTQHTHRQFRDGTIARSSSTRSSATIGSISPTSQAEIGAYFRRNFLLLSVHVRALVHTGYVRVQQVQTVSPLARRMAKRYLATYSDPQVSCAWNGCALKLRGRGSDKIWVPSFPISLTHRFIHSLTQSLKYSLAYSPTRPCRNRRNSKSVI